MRDIFYRLGMWWIIFVSNITSYSTKAFLSQLTDIAIHIFDLDSKRGSRRNIGLMDILVGFYLTATSKRNGVRSKRSVVPLPKNTSGSRPAWMLDTPNDSEEWSLIRRCAELSVAMYTFPTYILLPSHNWLQCIFGMLFNIVKLFYLWFFERITSFFIPLPVTREIVGDGWLWKKTAAFLASARLSPSDLQMSSFLNGVCQTPFALVTDHKNKAIIVAIRGSASLSDWIITDFSIYPRVVPEVFRDGKWLMLMDKFQEGMSDEEIADWIKLRKSYGSAEMANVHGPMFLSAVYIYGAVVRMISPMVDKDGINGKNGAKWWKKIPSITNWRSHGELDDYKIVVTGHSLGAGVGALLTLLLRGTYGDKVRGYCFSPPGCIVTECLLPLTKKCIMSFVVGDDFVPRASYHSAKELQQSIVNSVDEHNGDNHQSETNRMNENDQSQQAYPRLYIPGHVLHLTEEYDGKDEQLQIAGDWIENKPLQHIVLSRQMINDHLPKRVERIVKREPLVWWMKILPGEIIDAFY